MVSRPVLRRAAVVAAALFLASCSSATSPNELSLRFVVDEPQAGSDPSAPAIPGSGFTTQSANAASAPGVIVVIGRIVLPSSCYKLSADARQSGSSLDITITGRVGAEVCTGAIVTQGYSLRIGSLHSGLHHVRVVHEIIDSNPQSSLVLERDVYVD